jgi:hypothetical protein
VNSGQLGIMYDSWATNRSAAGGGGSHNESSLLLIGRQGVLYASQPLGNALFFIAIEIKVNPNTDG